MFSKSLFKSKTFWFNVLVGAIEITQVIPLPGAAALVVPIGNIILRRMTDQPVHVLPKP